MCDRWIYQTLPIALLQRSAISIHNDCFVFMLLYNKYRHINLCEMYCCLLKNGRLEDADASLLQWIGDSAIPCTPEVQHPKVKSASTKYIPVLYEYFRD